MLTKKQVSEIKEHLERAQRPIFFFDNDPDGLCSFLLLQRYIGRGKGVSIKSFPELIEDDFRKVHELNADYIFILDKPLVSKSFFDQAEKFNIPIVWIDHHVIDKKDVPDFVNYYNPVFNKKKSEEPVTALCYQVTERKEDLWLAVAGSISDHFVPDFYKDFEKKYPEFKVKEKTPFGILYNSPIGKIIMILSFGLKDRTTNVVNMAKFLIGAKSPYDVLEENKKNKSFHERYKTLNSKYQHLLEKAVSARNFESKILFFKYAGDFSVSRDLSNELSYKFSEKIIVVIYVRGLKANISMRGENVKDLFLKSIKDFENATGGGHRNAVGGQMQVKDVEEFRERLEGLVK
jgi:single-stranded DNA-specific DHH superfamily exonuclease